MMRPVSARSALQLAQFTAPVCLGSLWQLAGSIDLAVACKVQTLGSKAFKAHRSYRARSLQRPCLAESIALRIRNLQRSIAFKGHRSCSGRPNFANIHLVHQWTPRHHIVCLVNSLGCLNEYVQANMLKTSRLPWIRSNGFKRVCSFRMCSTNMLKVQTNLLRVWEANFTHFKLMLLKHCFY